MKLEYYQWIEKHYSNADTAYGHCEKATKEMVITFPELRQARGHYICPIWGLRQHRWCAEKDGRIVDPTASQFPSRGLGSYEEAHSDMLVRVGTCMECGEPIMIPLKEAEVGYRGDIFCSRECENNMINCLNAGLYM